MCTIVHRLLNKERREKEARRKGEKKEGKEGGDEKDSSRACELHYTE